METIQIRAKRGSIILNPGSLPTPNFVNNWEKSFYCTKGYRNLIFLNSEKKGVFFFVLFFCCFCFCFCLVFCLFFFFFSFDNFQVLSVYFNLFSPSTWFKTCMVRYIWLWVERKLFLKNPPACTYPISCGGQKNNIFFFFFCFFLFLFLSISKTLHKLTKDSTKQKYTDYLITKSEKNIIWPTKNIFYIVNHYLQLNYKKCLFYDCYLLKMAILQVVFSCLEAAQR